MVKDPGEASTARLYRATLGARGAEHYLTAFARFDERGRSGASWNTAAAIFNLVWLICRGLWGAAGLLAVLMAVLGLVMEVLWLFADWVPLGVKVGVSLTMILLLLVVPGLFGTSLLHARVRQRMIAAVQRAPTLDAACESLQAQAHRDRRRCAIGLVGLTAVILALGVARQVETVALASIPKVAPAPPVVRSTAPISAPLPAPQMTPVTKAPGEARQPAADGQASPGPATLLPPDAINAAEPPVLPASEEASKTSPDALRDPTKGFGVAVGRFAVAANAQRVVAKLSDAGLPVFTDSTDSAGGTLTRVRVGPFAHRAEADAAAQRVRALKLEALVYPP